MTPEMRQPDDDRVWEHRLFPLLVIAFGAAVGATLAGTAPLVERLESQPAGARTFVRQATFPARRHIAPPPSANFKEVRIADVVVNEGDATSVVLLSSRDAETVIPIFVETPDGESIRDQLRTAGTSTVSLKSFLAQTIDALGGTIERVEVNSHLDDRFTSQIVISHGGSQVALDAELPDALALAAATGSPVYVDQDVMEADGIQREEIRHKPAGFPSPLRRPDSL